MNIQQGIIFTAVTTTFILVSAVSVFAQPAVFDTGVEDGMLIASAGGSSPFPTAGGETGSIPVNPGPGGETGSDPVDSGPGGETGSIPVNPGPGGETGSVPRPTTGGNPGNILITIKNPLAGGVDTLYEFIKTIVDKVILPIGAVVAVIFIIYSGFLFVTAQGSEEKLRTAKSAFMYAVIGTAILLGAWVISTAIQATIDSIRTGTGMISPTSLL